MGILPVPGIITLIRFRLAQDDIGHSESEKLPLPLKIRFEDNVEGMPTLPFHDPQRPSIGLIEHDDPGSTGYRASSATNNAPSCAFEQVGEFNISTN